MTNAQLTLNQNISSKGKALKVFPETLKLNALKLRLAKQTTGQRIYNVQQAK